MPLPSGIEQQIRRAVRGALGAEVEALEPIAGSLGLRRFARARLSGPGAATLIARVEAPEDPAGRPAGAAPEPPLEPVRALFAAAGLPVPRRLGADEAHGVELLEDLGDLSLAEAARGASPAERDALYAEACGLVPRIQRLRDPGGLPAFARRLDAELFRYKAGLFAEWSLACRGRAASPAERRLVEETFALAARAAAAAPARLAHRDLQGSNLLVRPGRPPGERLAMIDLQGALLAPPEYDLVCLLRDSYLELSEAELDAQIERVRPRLPDPPDPETFAARFDLLTLTRKGKDHARFLYAASTRGRRDALAHLPASVRYLRRAAARAAARDPGLRAFAELVHELPERPCAA